MYAGWVLASVLTFYPLVRAPSALAVKAPLRAAGVAVANSVFYYPQPSLWRALDPQGAQRDVYNRYQRLLFDLAPQYGAQPYAIDSPRLDEVRLTMDPARFDFRLLDADFVLAPTHGSDALSSNSTLESVVPAQAAGGYVLLRVRR